MQTITATAERRHDLDWLRVIAILLLLYFHTAMIFVAEWGWHIKSQETSYALLEFNFFLSRWRMALLFLISGVGTGYALGRRSVRRYIRERSLRLGVPVLFGMLVIVPPQIYFERLANGTNYSSYLAFWPSVLQLQPYPAGNTSWHHLWFVAYLLIYSVVALPLFLYLRSDRSAAVREGIERILTGRLYLLAVPLGAVMAVLLPIFPGPQDIVSDLAHMLYYFLFFVYGYILYRSEGLWAEVEGRRRSSLGIAILCIVLINAIRWNGGDPGNGYSLESIGWRFLHALNAASWVLAILGYGRRHLNFRNRFLAYANEGIYPFYILHQTVIVVVGFYAIRVGEPPMVMFWFVSTVSLLLTVAIYEYVVRPYRATRFLFGMKPAGGTTMESPAGTAARAGGGTPVAVQIGRFGEPLTNAARDGGLVGAAREERE